MEYKVLFRGKRLDNVEWLYGSLLTYRDGVMEIAEKLNKHTLIKYEVDPATIGRYTGLTDKNGVKIFDGDIVRFAALRNRESIHQVIYEGWRWNLSNFYETGYDCPRCGFSEGTQCIEVIGNIHDNPELLGGAG